MKIYPDNSTLTARQRIERSFRAKRIHDPYVTIHNCNDGDGFLFGFFLDDYEDIRVNPLLDRRLVIETKSQKNIVLGIDL